MLPIELNTNYTKSSKELGDAEELALNFKKPNLALCKQLIFSCTKNMDSSYSNNLSDQSESDHQHSSSQDFSLNGNSLKPLITSSEKKRVSFGKNDFKIVENYLDDCSKSKEFISDSSEGNYQKCPMPVLKCHVQNVSSKIRLNKRDKKRTNYSLKISLAKKSSSKKLKQVHKVVACRGELVKHRKKEHLSSNVASQGVMNGIVKTQRKKHLSTKKCKQYIEKLTLKLKKDFYGEKLLNILNKIRSSKLSIVIDKNLGITLCLLSILVYKKFSDKKFKKLLSNRNKPDSSIFQKRINSIRKGLENVSSPKFQEKKKYLRVSLKKLPDCILNHFKNQSTSLSELPNYICNSCKTADLSIAILKLPDQILRNYQKGKPIMISNLPISILNSFNLHPSVVDS